MKNPNNWHNILKSLVFLIAALLAGCMGETTLVAPECGNGRVETGEQCDDGNRTDGDGCSRWCVLEGQEDCANGQDDDGDGLVDCADPDCDCPSPEICGNSLDDDGDGLTDCDDPDCRCHQPEDCANRQDDDGDGLADCEDSDCAVAQACGACPSDGQVPDGQVGVTLAVHAGPEDRVDAPCFSGPEGVWVMEVTEPVSLKTSGAAVWLMKEEEPHVSCMMDDMGCSSELDIQLVPPGTYRMAASGDATVILGIPSYEDCSNGWDDDLDGFTDCDDSDCTDTRWCPPPEDCSNGQDDDGDGLTDCDDPDCAVECAPPEDCSNGEDDDLDGRADCHDTDCVASGMCSSRACTVNAALGILERGDVAQTSYTTLDSSNFVALSCGGTGPDYTVNFSIDSTATVVVEVLQDSGRCAWALVGGAPEGGICRDGELACFGDSAVGMASSATFPSLSPASYFVVMDTPSPDASGQGIVRVSVYDPFGEICTNGRDDDGDGFVDCDDPGCASFVTCAGETVCHGGQDDDEDGLADCADPDCMQRDHCSQTGCVPDVFLGVLDSGGILARHVSAGDATAVIPCARGEQPSSVVAFELSDPSRIRVRLIPDGTSEPAMLLAAPAGSWTGCTDAPYMCVNVPSAGLASDVTTPDVLPAGTYFIVLTPYDSYSTSDALIVVQSITP